MSADVNIFAIVPIEVLQDSRLTLWHIKVLIALLSFRNKNTNLTCPSREKLSIRTGLHISNISKATKELCELGWLSKEGKGGYSKSTRYEITVPEFLSTVVDSATVVESTTVVNSAISTVVDSATRVVVDSATRKEQTNITDQLTNNTPTPKANPRINALDDGFLEFWNKYPKKTGKDEAHKSWKKKKPNVDHVLKTLAWQVESEQWTKQQGQFIPNPTTYLNQGRWQDEPPVDDFVNVTPEWARGLI